MSSARNVLYLPSEKQFTIPYRCPHCSSFNQFATLADLKEHYQEDHMSRPRKTPKRCNVFRDTWKNEIGKQKTYDDNKSNIRPKSPLSMGLEIDNDLLMQRVLYAKDDESNNKRNRIENLHHFKQELDTLNDRLMKTREDKWLAEDTLCETRDVLDNLERSAEIQKLEQQDTIETLRGELNSKEDLLSRALGDLDHLSKEKKRLDDQKKELMDQVMMSADRLNNLEEAISEHEKTLERMFDERETVEGEMTQQLYTKEKEVVDLVKFLRTSAQKEKVARDELEQFVSGLIDRVSQAEGDPLALEQEYKQNHQQQPQQQQQQQVRHSLPYQTDHAPHQSRHQSHNKLQGASPYQSYHIIPNEPIVHSNINSKTQVGHPTREQNHEKLTSNRRGYSNQQQHETPQQNQQQKQFYDPYHDNQFNPDWQSHRYPGQNEHQIHGHSQQQHHSHQQPPNRERPRRKHHRRRQHEQHQTQLHQPQPHDPDHQMLQMSHLPYSQLYQSAPDVRQYETRDNYPTNRREELLSSSDNVNNNEGNEQEEGHNHNSQSNSALLDMINFNNEALKLLNTGASREQINFTVLDNDVGGERSKTRTKMSHSMDNIIDESDRPPITRSDSHTRRHSRNAAHYGTNEHIGRYGSEPTLLDKEPKILRKSSQSSMTNLGASSLNKVPGKSGSNTAILDKQQSFDDTNDKHESDQSMQNDDVVYGGNTAERARQWELLNFKDRPKKMVYTPKKSKLPISGRYGATRKSAVESDSSTDGGIAKPKSIRGKKAVPSARKLRMDSEEYSIDGRPSTRTSESSSHRNSTDKLVNRMDSFDLLIPSDNDDVVKNPTFVKDSRGKIRMDSQDFLLSTDDDDPNFYDVQKATSSGMKVQKTDKPIGTKNNSSKNINMIPSPTEKSLDNRGKIKERHSRSSTSDKSVSSSEADKSLLKRNQKLLDKAQLDSRSTKVKTSTQVGSSSESNTSIKSTTIKTSEVDSDVTVGEITEIDYVMDDNGIIWDNSVLHQNSTDIVKNAGCDARSNDDELNNTKNKSKNTNKISTSNTFWYDNKPVTDNTKLYEKLGISNSKSQGKHGSTAKSCARSSTSSANAPRRVSTVAKQNNNLHEASGKSVAPTPAKRKGAQGKLNNENYVSTGKHTDIVLESTNIPPKTKGKSSNKPNNVGSNLDTKSRLPYSGLHSTDIDLQSMDTASTQVQLSNADAMVPSVTFISHRNDLELQDESLSERESVKSIVDKIEGGLFGPDYDENSTGVDSGADINWTRDTQKIPDGNRENFTCDTKYTHNNLENDLLQDTIDYHEAISGRQLLAEKNAQLLSHNALTNNNADTAHNYNNNNPGNVSTGLSINEARGHAYLSQDERSESHLDGIPASLQGYKTSDHVPTTAFTDTYVNENEDIFDDDVVNASRYGEIGPKDHEIVCHDEIVSGDNTTMLPDSTKLSGTGNEVRTGISPQLNVDSSFQISGGNTEIGPRSAFNDSSLPITTCDSFTSRLEAESNTTFNGTSDVYQLDNAPNGLHTAPTTFVVADVHREDITSPTDDNLTDADNVSSAVSCEITETDPISKEVVTNDEFALFMNPLNETRKQDPFQYDANYYDREYQSVLSEKRENDRENTGKETLRDGQIDDETATGSVNIESNYPENGNVNGFTEDSYHTVKQNEQEHTIRDKQHSDDDNHSNSSFDDFIKQIEPAPQTDDVVDEKEREDSPQMTQQPLLRHEKLNFALDIPENGDPESTTNVKSWLENGHRYTSVDSESVPNISDQWSEVDSLAPSDSVENLLDGSSETRAKKRSVINRHRQALLMVFCHLDTYTVCVVALVCKEWRKVSMHPRLWRRVEFSDCQLSTSYLTKITKRCSEMTSLVISNVKPRSKRDGESEEGYSEKISGSLELGLEHLLKTSQNTLVHLSIHDCGPVLSQRALWLVSCYSRLLQSLSYTSQQDNVGGRVLWALGAGCRDIIKLRVPPLSVSDIGTDRVCLTVLGKCFPDLTHVAVGGSGVDTDGLTSLVKSCRRLKKVELHFTSISDEMAVSVCESGLSELQALIVVHCHVSPDAVLTFIERCRHLQTFTISISLSDFINPETEEPDAPQFFSTFNTLQRLTSNPRVASILRVTSDDL